MDLVTAKEDEVNGAYAIFKKERRQAKKNGETIPIDSTIPPDGSRQYKLFSSDHVQWLYNYFMYPTQRADFHYVDGRPLAKREEKPLFGNIYISEEVDYQICPVPILTRARRKDVKLGSNVGKQDVRIKFFHEKYLKLSLPREMVFLGRETLSSGAPARFEFVGILRDLEKEKEERRKAAEEEKKNYPASPRESYFEMNHPMGWWAQSRW